MSEGLGEFRYLEEFLAMVDDARMGLGDYTEALRESAGGQQEYTNKMMRNIKWLSNEQTQLETRFAPSQYIPPPLPSALAQQPPIGRMVGGQRVLPGMEGMVGAGGAAQFEQLRLLFTGEMTTGAAMRGDVESQADAMRSVMRTGALDRESRERMSQMTPAEGGGLRGIAARWQADQRSLAAQEPRDVRRETWYALMYNRAVQGQVRIIGDLGGQLRKTSQGWEVYNRQIEGSQRRMDVMTESLGLATVALEEQATSTVAITAVSAAGTFLEVGAGAADAAIGLNSMLMVIESLAPVLGVNAVLLGAASVGIGLVAAASVVAFRAGEIHVENMENESKALIITTESYEEYIAGMVEAARASKDLRAWIALSNEHVEWSGRVLAETREEWEAARLAMEDYTSTIEMTASAIETTIGVAFAMAPQAAMAFGEIRRAEETYRLDMLTLTERHEDLLTMAQEKGLTDRLERQINQNEEAQARLRAQQEGAREAALRAMGGIVLDFLSVAAEAGAFETLVDYQNAVFQTMQEFGMATAGDILTGKEFIGQLGMAPEIGMGQAISGAATIAADALTINANNVTVIGSWTGGPGRWPTELEFEAWRAEKVLDNEIGNELRLQGVHSGR